MCLSASASVRGPCTDHQAVTEDEGVTGLEVRPDPVQAGPGDLEPVPAEPRRRAERLPTARREPHVGQHHPAAPVGLEVHRVHHVRRVGSLVDHLDRTAGRDDRVPQSLPLAHRPIRGRAGR